MKRNFKLLAFGTGLVAVLLLPNLFPNNGRTFVVSFLTAVAVIAVGMLSLNLYFYYYTQKMGKAAKLLEAGQAKAYIEEVEKLCRQAKGKHLRNTLQLNLSAGYCHLSEYEKAIEILEGLPLESLKESSVKVIRNVNLCGCYFATAQDKKAVELYDKSQEIFKPFRKNKIYSGSIAIIDISVSIEKGQYDRAKKVLDYARKTWDDPKFQEAYGDIEAELEKKIGAQDNT